MPRDAFVLKIQIELCHLKYARNVSGLLRNRPQEAEIQAMTVVDAFSILFSVGNISFFVCKYVICGITLRWSKNSENVVIVCTIHGNRKYSIVGGFHRRNKIPSGIT